MPDPGLLLLTPADTWNNLEYSRVSTNLTVTDLPLNTTHNPLVEGSSPSRPTIYFIRDTGIFPSPIISQSFVWLSNGYLLESDNADKASNPLPSHAPCMTHTNWSPEYPGRFNRLGSIMCDEVATPSHCLYFTAIKPEVCQSSVVPMRTTAMGCGQIGIAELLL